MKYQFLGGLILPTNNFVERLVTTLNDIVGAGQTLAPAIAAVAIVGCLILYMYSDKFSDLVKIKMFKIFIAIGGIAGVTSVVSWIQNISRF